MAMVMQFRKMITKTTWSNILWVMILLHIRRNLLREEKKKSRHRLAINAQLAEETHSSSTHSRGIEHSACKADELQSPNPLPGRATHWGQIGLWTERDLIYRTEPQISSPGNAHGGFWLLGMGQLLPWLRHTARFGSAPLPASWCSGLA